jgi:pimeloyl-ACP methyl ester carboxylesterase
MLEYWAHGFDWRERESELNRLPQFRARIDGVDIHFVHQRAVGRPAIPLILTHGWPSLFSEVLPLVPLLTDPRASGIAGPAFDVVIPSLPGYGYSERPARVGVNYQEVGRLWHRLMQGLGYERYGVGGGDFGAGVSTFMALENALSVIGLHLWTVEIEPQIREDTTLSDAERNYLEQSDRWWQVEGGYKAIQSSRPQTLGYGQNDSPAGLAGWVLEKWRAWSDSEGEADISVGRDFLLTILTIYWATGTITSSIRDYYDNRWHPGIIGSHDRVTVSTAFSLYPRQLAREPFPPREWLQRLYHIDRWTVAGHGGHFAPIENPTHLAHEICAFFAGL